MWACVCASVHVHAHTPKHSLTHAPPHILIHSHLHTYPHSYSCVHTHTLTLHTLTYTYSHTNIYLLTYKQSHTHTHTQMVYTSRENYARWESASFYRWEDQVLELVQDDMQSRSGSCTRSIPGPLSPFGSSPFSSDTILQGLRSSGRGRKGKTRPFSQCPLAELFLWLFSTCTMLPLGVFWPDWEPIHCWLKPCCSSMADSMESLAQKPDGNKLFQ